MKSFAWWCAVGSWMVLGVAFVEADFLTPVALTLVADGEPQATILTPAEADGETQNAAQELQTYVRKITGAELPVKTEADAPAGATVHVGRTKRAEERCPELAELDRDGFLARTEGNTLFLVGRTGPGTEFAVYWFLQKVGGVRWFMPMEIGEVVPKRPTLAVPTLDERQEPDFLSRLYSGLPGAEGARWAKRNLMRRRFNFHHNLLNVIKPSQYGPTNPDFFPLVNGERRIPTRDDDHGWQPCMSHPKVIEICAAAARKFFDEHPDEVSFSLGINDSNTYCECENCLALDVPNATFRGRPNKSDRVFAFMNAVAEELMKTHPDKYLGCLAYSWCEAVPTKVKVHPHVIPYLTNDRAQWRDPAFRAEDERLLRAWTAAVPIVAIYDYYYGAGYVSPRVFTQLIDESLKFCHRVGVRGFYAEIYPNWGLDGPKGWLAAQLLWDVSQDRAALLEEFYTKFFAEAAGPMRKFFERCEEAWMKQGGPAHWFKGFFDQRQLEIYPPEFVGELTAYLRQAKALARDEAVRARVAFIDTAFGYTRRFTDVYWASQKLLTLTVNRPADVRTALAWIQRLTDSFQELKRYETEVIEVDPWQKPCISFWERCHWDPLAPVLGTLGRVLHWGEEEGVWAEVEAELRRLIERQPEAPLADYARLHLALRTQRDRLVNLIPNPSFEETAGGTDKVGGLDWSRDGAPPPWGRWNRPGTPAEFRWDDTVAHQGTRSVRMKGCLAACYVLNVEVQPGETYYCSAYARSSVDNPPRTELLIQWKDAAGEWVSQPASSCPLVGEHANEWVPLSTLFTVPEGVAYAVVGLVVYDQQEDEAAWFDDVFMAKVPQ